MYDRLEIILSLCEKGKTFLIRAPIDTSIQNLWKADLDLYVIKSKTAKQADQL